MPNFVIVDFGIDVPDEFEVLPASTPLNLEESEPDQLEIFSEIIDLNWMNIAYYSAYIKTMEQMDTAKVANIPQITADDFITNKMELALNEFKILTIGKDSYQVDQINRSLKTEAFNKLWRMFHPTKLHETLGILYGPKGKQLNTYVIQLLEFFLEQNSNGLQGGQRDSRIWDAVSLQKIIQ